MSIHVKKGDNVLILAGKDKGKTGRVMLANPDNGRIVVDGINIITKHKKAKSAQVPGGIEKMAGTIDASNVQIICAKCNKAVRISNKDINGKKSRVCPKCGANLDEKIEKKEKKVVKKVKADKVEKVETKVATETTESDVKPAKKARVTKKSALEKSE